MRDHGNNGIVAGLRPEKLPQPLLIDLLKTYCRLYYAMDGFWYLSVRNRFGDDSAVELDLWVWRKQAKYEMDHLTRLLGIQGDDVASFMKAFGASPWFINLEYDVELDGKDRAVFSVTRCPTLEALEKEGNGRESRHCQTVEPAIFKFYADYFNPAIEVRGLVVPPRKNRTGLCCKWEFKLERG
ncbi:MAG TPA: L-2-amino-thiazoline-4-carboxylic acid hydrolase [Dehalococcoidia bacterium]|nr:L-2-amino-thiazoline-4-carboxylic acid hydrolase [Dehalococcoidia bacterium]